MAKDGYNISIGADTTAAEKGIRKGVIEPLEDLNEVLEEVAKEANTSGDKLEDAMRDAQRDTEELADETKKLSAAITDAGRSGRGMGDDFKRGTDRAQEGLQEVQDESRSTAKEAAASFDGSAESIVGAFQEVAANAFAGFGAAGLVAGAAVAVGIGLATAEFQKSEEAAQAAKERVRQLGLSIIESGAEIAGIEQFQDSLKLIITDADDAAAKLEDIDKFASKFEKYGLDADVMAMAYAGNADAIETMVKQLEDAADAESKVQYSNKESLDIQTRTVNELRSKADSLRDVQEETERAKEIEEAWLNAGGAEAEAKAAAISSINSAYDDAAGSVQDYVNSETGVLDVDAYIASMQARQQSLLDYQNSLATSGFTTEQKAALNAMGLESAATFMSGYQSASPQNKEAMKQILTDMASESSGVAQDTIEETFKKPTKAKIEAEADTKDAKKAIDKLVEDRVVKVTVDVRDREGKPVP